MKVNLTAVLKDDKGIEVEDGSLKTLLVNALFSNLKGDETLDGKKKYEMYTLSKKISEAEEEVELSAEEITLLKDRVGKAYVVLFMGQIWDMLEGKA